ncbi:MAG: hypothetical protein V3R37_01280 [Rhodospirillales bacterium]
MTFNDMAAKAVEEVTKALDIQPSDEQTKSVHDILHQIIVNAVLEERSRCATVVTNVCSADQDLAHKMQAQIRADEAALIANLSSLR